MRFFLFFCALFTGTMTFADEVERPIVVFDFGGVMADFDLREMMGYCADVFELPLDDLKQIIKADIDRLAVGAVSEQEFWMDVEGRTGGALPADWKELFQDCIARLVHPREDMYQLVDQLKSKGYQVALLSDVTDWQGEVFRELGLYDPFDPVLLSCHLGVRKPDPRVYHLLLERLDIAPEQCLFVDDRPENVEGACAVGITGIQYTTFDETRDAISDALAEQVR